MPVLPAAPRFRAGRVRPNLPARICATVLLALVTGSVLPSPARAADAATDLDTALAAALARDLRRAEQEISVGARALARELTAAVGRGLPLTDIGDRVATPLQTQRIAEIQL